jgi:hypothetical protein
VFSGEGNKVHVLLIHRVPVQVNSFMGAHLHQVHAKAPEHG